MKVAPITIHFMLHCHFSMDPFEQIGQAQWYSKAGERVRKWLIANELVTIEYRSTDKGKAWIKMICDTSLPLLEQKWIDPTTGDVISVS